MGIALGVIRAVNLNSAYSSEIVPADFVINCVLAIASRLDNTLANRFVCIYIIFLHLIHMIIIVEKLKMILKFITFHQLAAIRLHGVIVNKYGLIFNTDITLNYYCLGYFKRPMLSSGFERPFVKCMWYMMVFVTKNPYLHSINVILFHNLPAYIIDAVISCFGKKPK